MPKDRPKIFKDMFVPLWEEQLRGFSEFSFSEKELKFHVEISMRSINLGLERKLYENLFRTYAMQKSKILIKTSTKKNVFVFTRNGSQIAVNAIPSLASIMIQILITLTRERLSKEKYNRIIAAKSKIKETIQNILINGSYTTEEVEEKLKVEIFYKKGVYNVKARLIKKNNFCYVYVDEVNEAMFLFEENINLNFKVK